MTEDPGLVAELKRGEAKAFERAFALYQPGIARFLERLTRNQATAVELCSRGRPG